jgi:hypothetical protein
LHPIRIRSRIRSRIPSRIRIPVPGPGRRRCDHADRFVVSFEHCYILDVRVDEAAVSRFAAV